jgi:hypothetical protein
MAITVDKTGVHGSANLSNVQGILFQRNSAGGFNITLQSVAVVMGENKIIDSDPGLNGTQKTTVWNAISATVLAAINAQYA